MGHRWYTRTMTHTAESDAPLPSPAVYDHLCCLDDVRDHTPLGCTRCACPTPVYVAGDQRPFTRPIPPGQPRAAS
jgi:hypothetical protein